MKLWLMRLFLAIFVIFLNLTGCSHKARSSEGFTLTFIHVGKGDAFLMTVPGDGYYLVDTGKKKDFEEIREVLEEKGVTSLQGIFPYPVYPVFIFQLIEHMASDHNAVSAHI